MRFWTTFLSLVLGLSGAAFAAPSALTLSTDAPARTGSGNYFVRASVDESATYTGLVTLTVEDTYDWVTDGWTVGGSGVNLNMPSQFAYGAKDGGVFADPTNAGMTAGQASAGTQTLYWRSQGNTFDNGIVNVVNNFDGTFAFTIRVNGKGSQGYAFYVAAFDTADDIGGQNLTTYDLSTENYALIDANSPEQGDLLVTAPTANQSQTNFIGRSVYDVTAAANIADDTFTLDTSANTEDTVLLEFYSTNVSAGGWESDSSTMSLGQSFLSGSSANVVVDFTSDNVRQAYLGLIGYDAAGNPTVSQVDTGSNLLATKWLALGQFQDDRVGTWHGNTTYAGNWESSAGANISAGANVSLRFFATDFYGELDQGFTSTNTVELGSATLNAPTATGFDGSTSDIEIGSANVTTFAGNGRVTYAGCVILYRQEHVSLGTTYAGTDLWSVDSPLIEVRHNIVDDVIFVASGNVSDGTWPVTSSDNGVSSAVTTGTPLAGEAFGIQVAAVDQWLNITNTTGYGGGDTVTLLGSASDNITAAANIDGYSAYNGTALSYSLSYPGTETWSVNGTGGLVTLSANYYVEESGNVTINVTTADGITSDNTSNNEMRLTVDKASSKVVYFDDTAGYSFTGNLSGNYFTAGGTNTIYAHVTDLYGNHYVDSDDSVTLSANYVGGTIQSAYRNDASNYSVGSTVESNGIVTFSGIRFDRSTYSGNSTRDVYSNFGLVAELNGSGNYYSESIGVAGNAITHVYFSTDGGEPTSAANLLTASSNMNASGNAVAGNTLLLYAVVTDEWGNVDISGGNTVWIDLVGVADDAPDGTVASGSNVETAIGGNILSDIALTATLVGKQTSLQLTLSSNGLVSESSNLFDVVAGAQTDIQFVQSGNGIYGSGNAMVNILAGNTITVGAAGVDQYSNTVSTIDASTISVGASLSGNVVKTSASGNAPSFSRIANLSGYATFSVNLFDAEDSVVLRAYDATYSTNSEYFNVSANVNTNGNIQFVDSATFTNDDISSGSDNVLRSAANLTGIESSGNAIAGNAITFILAELDGYGNLTDRSGSNLVLSSHSMSGNFALTGANTTSANNVDGIGPDDGEFTTSSFATITNFTPYTAESSIRVMAAGNAGSNLTNLSPSFNVDPGTPALFNFTISNGAWQNTTVDISNAGDNEALEDVYVGVYDAFGNNADLTRDTVTAGVNVVAYEYYTGIPASGNYSSGNIQFVSPSTNVTNNVIYFDPNDDADKIVFTGSGCFSLNLMTNSTDIATFANTQMFRITDTAPPTVTLESHNGGGTYFSGDQTIIRFNAADTTVEGTYFIYVSYDSGLSFESTPINSGDNTLTGGSSSVDQSYTWSVPAGINSETVRLRVQVTDGTGNVDEDESDADFSISPFSSVVSYIVGDTSGNTARLSFREPVYSNTGGDLGVLDFQEGADLTLAAVTHSMGTATANLTFSNNVASSNINSSTATVGLESGNVSRNGSGAGAFSSVGEIAGVEIHQIVSGNLGAKTLTASTNLSALGLKLVGWSASNISVKEMKVQIDSVTGSVNTADLEAFTSDNLISEAISLVDSNGTVIPFAVDPTLAIGSEMTISVNHVLPTTPLTGSDNYNYYLYIGSSNILSDSENDALTLTLNSILFEDYSTGANVEKLYVPFGTRVSDQISADSTAPAAPTVTYSANINDESTSASYYQSFDLTIQSEAGANIHYVFDDVVGAGSGNLVSSNLISGNGTWTTSVNLISLGNTTVELTVWAIDEAGNDGNTQSLTFSANLTKDLMGISAANVGVVFNAGVNSGNITSASNTSASVNIALTEAGEEGASYTLTLIDSVGMTQVETGSFGSSANTVLISGLDLSGLAEGALSVNLLFTDQYGNTNGSSNLTSGSNWNVEIDTLAPAMGNLIAVSGDNLINLAEATAGVNLGLDSLDGYATINFVLSGNSGNLVRLGSNVLMAAGNFASNNILTDFADGSITLTANATDPNANRSADLSMTITLDTIADNTMLTTPSVNLGRPTLVWSQVNDAASYELYVDGTATNTLLGSDNLSQEFSGNLSAATYTWSVNVIDLAGNESIGSSANFTVSNPSAPMLVTVSANGQPTFAWNPVADAYQYFFALSAAGQSLTGNISTLSTNVYAYGDNLMADTYTWSVNVLDVYGNSSTFSENVFVVSNPVAPTLVSPEGNGIGRPTFVWETVADKDSYFFSLSAAGQVLAGNTSTLSTNSLAYASNLMADTYTWSVNVTDIYGNSSTISSNTFVVSNPVAPTLSAPVDGIRANVNPTLSWASVSDANEYMINLTGMALPTSTGSNLSYEPATLVEGVYTWSVNVTDIYGNTSDQSSDNTFEIIIPDITYVSADNGNATVVVGFSEGVETMTGAIDISDINDSDLGGALSVTHTSGDSSATITFAEAAIIGTDNINAVANSIKNDDGNFIADSVASELRQIAFEETVSSTTPFNYGGESYVLGKFKLQGWSDGSVGANTLNAFTYTLTATAGVVNGTDLMDGANVMLRGPSGDLSGSVTGSLGLSQTFALTANANLSSDATEEYEVYVMSESVSGVLDAAEAFKLTVASVNLSINGTDGDYKLAGDSETNEVILTTVALREPFSSAANNIYETSDNIFKVTGQTVTFIADYVSDSATATWTQVSGNAQTISVSATNVMTVTPTESGQFNFALSYTLDGYSFTTPTANITVLSKEEADALGQLSDPTYTLDTADDFLASVELLNQFVGGVTTSEAASLISSVENVLNQFETAKNGSDITESIFTQAQSESLVSLVDEAAKTLEGAALVSAKDDLLSVLDKIIELPTIGISSMVKGFNIFGTLASNSTAAVTADEIFSVSANLSLAALESIEDAGEKTFVVDTAADIKTSVGRIYSGQPNAAGVSDSLGSLVSVQISDNTLAQLVAANPGIEIEAIQATKLPSTGSETITGTTGLEIGSAIYEINIISRGGSVSVTGLTTPIEVSIRVDDVSALKNYTVAYYDEVAGQWVNDDTITNTSRPGSDGALTFEVDHLTRFAVFTSPRALSGGGGGGGCLLK